MFSFQNEFVTQSSRPILNPQKLLLSKWTAVEVCDKEKHFLVVRIINPEAPRHKIQEVEMEAVMSRAIAVDYLFKCIATLNETINALLDNICHWDFEVSIFSLA
jgi:hypothetical protein